MRLKNKQKYKLRIEPTATNFLLSTEPAHSFNPRQLTVVSGCFYGFRELSQSGSVSKHFQLRACLEAHPCQILRTTMGTNTMNFRSCDNATSPNPSPRWMCISVRHGPWSSLDLLFSFQEAFDLDDLLPTIGEFGKYQKLLVFGICLPACIPCGFCAFNQLFMADTPDDYWCRIRSCSTCPWSSENRCPYPRNWWVIAAIRVPRLRQSSQPIDCALLKVKGRYEGGSMSNRRG